MLSPDCTADELNAYLRTHATRHARDLPYVEEKAPLSLSDLWGRQNPPRRLPLYVVEVNGCYEWQGPVNKMGYGSFRSQRVNVYVANACGIAGPHDRVHQTCDNRRCIKPGHMYNPRTHPRTGDAPVDPERHALDAMVAHARSQLELYRDPRNQDALSNGMAYWEDDAGNRVATIA